MSLSSMRRVVSYSDGDGGEAGVGICVWAPHLKDPLLAFCKVPPVVRDLWHRRAGNTDAYREITLIEAVGPLAVLCTFPRILKDSLWLHSIDNESAQYSLVNGSSSIMSADHVIGCTWERAARINAWPYFDRVASKSNPIDGVSRGRREGPWKRIYQVKLPMEELVPLLSGLVQ